MLGRDLHGFAACQGLEECNVAGIHLLGAKVRKDDGLHAGRASAQENVVKADQEGVAVKEMFLGVACFP